MHVNHHQHEDRLNENLLNTFNRNPFCSELMMNPSDVTLNFGEEDEIDRQKKLKHPVTVFCHVAFRCLAVLMFILCGWFSTSFITNFIFIIILLSMDFWTVKNISGRLLVGLRWWNYVDDDGVSHWVYESRPKSQNKIKVSATEARLFWLSLIICQIIWIIFIFGTIFKLDLKWFMVALVGVIMNGANLYGYIRCKYGSKTKLSSVATGFLGQQIWSKMTRQEETVQK